MTKLTRPITAADVGRKVRLRNDRVGVIMGVSDRDVAYPVTIMVEGSPRWFICGINGRYWQQGKHGEDSGEDIIEFVSGRLSPEPRPEPEFNPHNDEHVAAWRIWFESGSTEEIADLGLKNTWVLDATVKMARAWAFYGKPAVNLAGRVVSSVNHEHRQLENMLKTRNGT